MALATKYRIEGTSDIYGKVTVNIKLDGYTGLVIPLEGATRDFVILKIGSSSNDISQTILPGEANIQYYAVSEFQTIEMAQSEPFTYLVEINDELGQNIWTGWVMPEDYSESYTNTPYLVNISASDYLDALKNVSMPSLVGTKISLWNALRTALAGTRLELRYLESISIYADGMDDNNQDSPLTQAEVTISTFEGLNCYDAINTILKPFFSRVYQYRGWRIENITEKRDNYIVRLYNIGGVFQSFFNSLSLVQLDNSPSNFSALIEKSGKLNFKPSLNYSSSYFASVQQEQATGLQGFDKLADWIDASNLVSWTNENGIIIQRVVTEYNGSEYGVWIDGKNDSFADDEYIQSVAIAVNPSTNENITIGFDYKMDYPSVIILGSKPILYVEFYLDGVTNDYYWTGTQWGNDRKAIRISASTRNVWRSFVANIGVLPEQGNLFIRIHKLVKSGSTGVTKLFLTRFFTNIAVESEQTNVYLFAQGYSSIESTYRGPSFEFSLSDGLILGAKGVLEFDNALTDNWNRAGKTDDLQLTSLFIYQWLTFHQYAGAMLQGTLYQKGEKITPFSTIEDDPSISTKRYILNSWEMSLGSGRGNVQFREIPQDDIAVTIATGTRTQIEKGDYLIPGILAPTGPTVMPELTPTTPVINFENLRFLNGDVTGDISTSELTPSAIVNKARLDFTGLTADDIVFNAVKNTLDQENMTNLRLSDIRTIIGTIPTASVIGRYDIDTSGTTAPVGTKDIRYNNATQISATQLFISDITEDNIDVDLFLSLIKQGSALVIQDRGDHLNYQTYEVSGTPTFASATWTFPVTFKDSGGTGTTGFANNHKVLLSALSSGSGSDPNKVSYNVADSKNATERNQARVNIGSTSATPQIIATAGAINDLTVTSNSLVFTGASVVLSGILAGLDGEEIAILNASGTNLELLSQSVLSSANNRFASGVIVPNLSILRIKYRTTTNRWFFENVGVNDGRYVRKDIADTKTGSLTLVGSLDLTSVGSGVINAVTPTSVDAGHRFGEGGNLGFSVGRYITGPNLGRGTPIFWRSAVSIGSFFWQSTFGVTTASIDSTNGRIFQARSGTSNQSTRRDELYLNYAQTVATAGTINDLAINADCKLLILTGATDLTGVVFVDNTRLLRIEARGGSRIIRDQSPSSTDVNRFALGADLTINDGEVYQFIYTNSRWRRVL